MMLTAAVLGTSLFSAAHAEGMNRKMLEEDDHDHDAHCAEETVDEADCILNAGLDNLLSPCKMYDAVLQCYSADCCEDMLHDMEVAAEALDCSPSCSAGCFPATSSVELADGSKVAMDQVQVGDKVLVGEGAYSEVYFFSTAMGETTSSFVELVAGKSTLSLTPGHFLYVNGELTKAGRVVVGDVVTLADGSSAKISKVGAKWGPGLYNPHTMQGDIIVDGVKTSTYTDAVHPTLAHALLYPVRKMYEAGLSFGETFSTSAKGVAALVPGIKA